MEVYNLKITKTKLFIIILPVLAFVILFLSTERSLIDNKQYNKIYSDLKDTKRIEIYHKFNREAEKNYEPIVVTDEKLINEILSFMSKVTDFEDRDMSGVAVKNQKISFYNSNNEQKIINYSYDNLHNFGEIKYNNEKFNLPYDFFRLINSLDEFKPQNTKVTNDVNELFKKYSWTPSFLISSQRKTLPNNFKYSSENTTEKIYWAYNMELSKDIGLDFSNLNSNDITAEIYSLIEPLPDSFEPLLDARGIVIRHDGRIVGAYIDSGRHEGKAISLKRHTFKEVKKEDLNVWIVDNCIDKTNSLYKDISKMSNEDLIRMHLKAMEENNTNELLATMDVESQISTLFINSDNRKLFNDTRFEMNLPDYINSDTIVYIEKMDLGEEEEKDKKSYNVIFANDGVEKAGGKLGFSDINIDVINDGGVWKVSGFTK